MYMSMRKCVQEYVEIHFRLWKGSLFIYSVYPTLGSIKLNVICLNERNAMKLASEDNH